MATRKTEAIVIRAFPLQEYHKIITFYTHDFGKVKGVAHGVRSPKNRLSGSLELLNHGTLLFQHRENRDLQNVLDFTLIDGFDAVRSDFMCISYGCYFAELVDSISSEGVVSPGGFNLLRGAYRFLAGAGDVPLLARGFEIKFLDCAGYGPELSQCVCCGCAVGPGSVSERNRGVAALRLLFSVRYGGLLCSNCEARDGAALTVAPGSCELLKLLRRSEWGQFNRIRASLRNHQELRYILGNFIEYHTERYLKSLKFIESAL